MPLPRQNALCLKALENFYEKAAKELYELYLHHLGDSGEWTISFCASDDRVLSIPPMTFLTHTKLRYRYAGIRELVEKFIEEAETKFSEGLVNNFLLMRPDFWKKLF